MGKLKTLWDQMITTIGGNIPFFQVTYKVIFVIVGAFILWLIIKLVLWFVEKKALKYRFIKINPELYPLTRKVSRYVLLLLTGAALIDILNLRFIEKGFMAVFVVMFAGPIKEFVLLALGYMEKNIVNKTDTKIDNIIFDLLNKFVGVIIYVVAGILALDTLGINVMPFVAGAGVVGIAIGFAAKDTLSNLIAGVLLIIDRPFEIGDRIEVWSAPTGSATWGDVFTIGLRATKIKTTDNIVIIIPNNEIMKRDIINYTIISAKIRVRVNIGVAYDADIKKAKAIICQVADGADWIAKDPPSRVMVRNFGESSVDLQLRIWIKDARKRMDTISYITDKVKEAFDKEGIEIPYPKRDITIIHKKK